MCVGAYRWCVLSGHDVGICIVSVLKGYVVCVCCQCVLFVCVGVCVNVCCCVLFVRTVDTYTLGVLAVVRVVGA